MSTPQPVLLSFKYTDPQTTQDISSSVMLDAAVNEQHVTTAQVTEHQVENGPDVADHIRPMPQKVTIEGVISNTPINNPTTQMGGAKGSSQKITANRVNYTAFKFDSDFDRVKDANTALVDAVEAGALFVVTTTLATYQNMAAVNYAVQRNVDNGNTLRFTIDFQELRIVETQTVAALPSSQKPKARGHQAPKPAEKTEEERAKSTAAAVLDWASR